MLHEEIRELLKARVDKITVVVAPFAVFLVEFAARLLADGRVVKRHTAALAMSCLGEPRSVFIDTSNSLERSFSVSVFGTVSPVSQRDTA